MKTELKPEPVKSEPIEITLDSDDEEPEDVKPALIKRETVVPHQPTFIDLASSDSEAEYEGDDGVDDDAGSVCSRSSSVIIEVRRWFYFAYYKTILRYTKM